MQRLGCEVIACDRYANAPAMQVAHRSHVFSMLDGARLREVIAAEKPDLIVPEIEAIATDVLVELEAQGARVLTQGEETVPRPREVMEEHTLLVEPPWNMRVEDLAGRAVELRIVRMLQEIPETVAEAETVAMIQSVVRVATAVQEL